MSGRYFVVVEPDGDSFAFESLAEAKRCEEAWDRGFYRSKPNRIVECVAMPRVEVVRVDAATGIRWDIHVNGVPVDFSFNRLSATKTARDLRRALRKGGGA